MNENLTFENGVHATPQSRTDTARRDARPCVSTLKIAIAIMFAMLFALQGQAQTYTVANLTDLETAVAAYGSAAQNVIIEVSTPFPITKQVIIPGNSNGRTLTIKSQNAGTPVTLTRGYSEANQDNGLFTIDADAKLVLEAIIIDGDKATYTANIAPLVMINSGGTLTMNAGAVLRNNQGVSGGGVFNDGGTFTMNNGEISGNVASISGGGVANHGTFTMNGGVIGGNTAGRGGGLNNGGNFYMNGGEITGNSCGESQYDNGGGVYVSAPSHATYITIGGTAKITGNTKGAGGSANNVFLFNSYITLGTGSNGTPAPAAGMSVGITKNDDGGVFVNTDASATHAQYFFADVAGKVIKYDNGALSVEEPIAIYVNDPTRTTPLTSVTAIQTKIDAELTAGRDATVTGLFTNAATELILNIPAGRKVVWKAKYSGTAHPLLTIAGNGTLEIASGGEITGNNTSNNSLITVSSAATLHLTGGKLENTQHPSGIAIDANGSGSVIVESGTIEAGSHAMYVAGSTSALISGGIVTSSSNTVGMPSIIVAGTAKLTVSGGTVKKEKTGAAIEVQANSIAALLGGTVQGNNGGTSGLGAVTVTGGNAMAVLWSGTAPITYSALTSTDLTTAGAGATAVWSNGNGTQNGIACERGTTTGFVEVPGVTVTRPNAIFVNDPTESNPLTTVAAIETAIQGELTAGRDVTVTGKLTGVTADLSLNIPAGRKVIWQADYSTSEWIMLDGSGTFEVGSGGTVSSSVASSASGAIQIVGTSAVSVTVSNGGKIENTNTGGNAILSYGVGTVTVDGGTVTAISGRAIRSGSSMSVLIKNGTVTNNSNNRETVELTGNDKLTVTGGTVRNNGTFYAIGLSHYAVAAILGGTVLGDNGGTSGLGAVFVPSGEINVMAVLWSVTASQIYTAFTSADLTTKGAGATAVWVNDGVPATGGIRYMRGTNTGFIPVTGVTVNKINPTVTTWPTASAITYGQTLENSTLSGGVGEGTFAWTTGSTIPNVTNTGYSVTFTPTDAANYNTITQNVAVTVNPKPLTGADAATTATVTIGGMYTWDGNPKTPATGNVSVELGGVTLNNPADYTFAVTSDGTYSGTQTVTVTGTGNYTGTATGTYTINRLTVSASMFTPTATAITYGNPLSASTLSGGGSWPGTWAWGDGTIIPNVPGGSYSATFTPTNCIDIDWSGLTGWNAATSTITSNVNVTVNKATIPAQADVVKFVMYSNTASQTVDLGALMAAYNTTAAALTYAPGLITDANSILATTAVTSNGISFTLISGLTVANLAHTATIPVTISGFVNYTNITLNVVVTLTDKTPVTVTIPALDKTYDGIAASVTATAPGIPAGDITCTWLNADGTSIPGNAPPVNAGNYRVKAEISGASATTCIGEATRTFTIAKATVTITAENKSATVGAALPTFTYTVSGLASGETLGGAVGFLTTANMSVAGIYTIFPQNGIVPPTGNYNTNIIYVNGTLTVSNPAVINPPSAPRITGPQSMMLQTGYTATSTGVYTVTGTSPVTVTKTKGDARITWNAYTWQLDIATGLPVGIYAVELTASNSAGMFRFTFTLTVAEKVYYMDIPLTFTGGTVVANTSNPYLASAGQLVTLTVTPDDGFELVSLSVYITGSNTLVPLTEIPATRSTGSQTRTFTFVMPASHITVVAVFGRIGDVSVVETENLPSLRAYVQDGVLYISGVAEGSIVRIYNMIGELISTSPYPLQRGTERAYPPSEGARGGILLPTRGIYIVTDGKSVVKVVN